MLDDDEIKAKVCPRCKTTVTKSRRYNEILKKNMEDLANVKRRSYGTERENMEMLLNLEERLTELRTRERKYMCKYFFFIN